MSKKYTVNEAIWIAAAVYAYHKYKTVETLKPSDFYLRTRELIKIAKNYTDKDVQDARIHQHCNGYHEQCTHKFLNKIAVDSGSPYFVVTYLGQFGGEREYPDGLNWNDSVEYEGNQYKLDDIKLYLGEEYAAFVQAHTFLPSVDLKYEEELYTIEQIRSRLSELGYSINNIALGMVQLGKGQSTIHRTKNKEILIYTTQTDFDNITTARLLKDDVIKYAPLSKEKIQEIIKNKQKGINVVHCLEDGNKILHPSDAREYNPHEVVMYSNASFRKVFKVITGADFIEELKEEYKVEVSSKVSANTEFNKNIILYGPPGTGKTYNTVIYAVAIIENKALQSVKEEEYNDVLKRYNSYKADGLIEFTTFHQSYGYEEFIEGIKPVMNIGEDDVKDVQYEIHPGLFKSFCEKAEQPVFNQTKADLGINKSPTVWKVSLEGTGDNPTRTECIENGHIRIGWDSYGESILDDTYFEFGGKSVLNAFIHKMKVGDIVLSCYSATTIDAIGVVTGEYEWHDEYEDYKRLRTVNWIVKNVRENITDINNGTSLTLSSVYKLNISLSDVMDLVSKNVMATDYVEESKKNHVFIIDEINRGNISKIFGELITLIEASKRVGQPEEMKVRLPYSQKQFGVPNNVYIIGTMNTADRSIATIDTALRRRFHFREMLPDANILDGIYVEDVSIRELLEIMNKRIAILYDREHTLGHAYFMPLKSNPSVETLGNIFADNIIPLLQEYFYEDYEKIRMVLGDNNKMNEAEQFVKVVENDFAGLFGSVEYEFEDTRTYAINQDAFANIEAYRKI